MTKTESFDFGGRHVGGDAPVLTIAELSGNHNGSFERSMEMVHAAADAGADAIKVQTYTADSITLRSDRPEFQAEGLWEGRTLHDLYAEASMPWEWQRDLCAESNRLGVPFFSSVFDYSSIDFLETIDIAGYKIASFEIVDVGLIKAAASTGKPMIMSTGMATLAEIEEAVDAARSGGAEDIALLVCTSAYPAPPSAANLEKIPHLAETFGVVSGLSDHTMGHEVPIAATALGAKVIEKHFTLRRADGGVDSDFSLEPEDFRELVSAVRTAEAAVGRLHYGPSNADASSRAYRRSLFVCSDIIAGQRIGPGDVRSVRPGNGLHPRHLDEVIGAVATRDLAYGTPLQWDMLSLGDR